MNILETEGANLLVKAIMAIDDEKTCKAFLEDLMSAKEIVEITQRMEVVNLLKQNKSYQTISEATSASSATISRINRCFVYGTGGYRTVLDKISK